MLRACLESKNHRRSVTRLLVSEAVEIPDTGVVLKTSHPTKDLETARHIYLGRSAIPHSTTPRATNRVL